MASGPNASPRGYGAPVLNGGPQRPGSCRGLCLRTGRDQDPDFTRLLHRRALGYQRLRRERHRAGSVERVPVQAQRSTGPLVHVAAAVHSQPGPVEALRPRTPGPVRLTATTHRSRRTAVGAVALRIAPHVHSSNHAVTAAGTAAEQAAVGD